MHRYLCNYLRQVRAPLCGGLLQLPGGPWRVAGLVALSLTTPALLAPGLLGAQEPPSVALGEIEKGQKGYGLSVFSGSEPERFEVEVLGVLQNVRPDLSYILGRLTGHGLEESGVISGMSGSPVFFDDRLAGAVAFAWSFSNEAIAGIVPIEAMRQLSQLPPAPPLSSAGGPGAASSRWSQVELRQLLTGEIPPDLLERHLARLGGGFPMGAGNNLQWHAVGFNDSVQSLFRRTLGAVAPAGRTHDLTVELEPGSAVAGLLMDGDLQLAATGTVTARDGDEILAFGHPFLGLGPLRIPMAVADVVTVVSSQASSFKLTNIGEVVGAFDQDRIAGMRGQVGLEAPTIPLKIKVRGLQNRDYQLHLADVPLMNPSLVASGVLQTLDAASYATGPQGVDLVARFELEGYEDLVIRQSFDGGDATFGTALYLLTLVNYLIQNPLEEVRLKGLEVELVQAGAPRTATLVGAHPDRTQVRPGDRVTLHLELMAYRGETYRRTVDVEIPAQAPKGPYHLFVGDGTSVDAARDRLQPLEPINFPQALRMLRSFRPRRELVVLGFVSGRGLVVAGHAMPSLPESVRSLWAAASPPSSKPLRFSIAREYVEALDRPMDGLVRIDLEVLRPLPSKEVR